MLRRTHYTDEIETAKEENFVLSGWVHEIKDLARTRFIWLRDRHGVAQVTILKSSASPEILRSSENLGREDVIAVEGKPVKVRVAKVGAEISPNKIELISKSLETAPLDISGKIESVGTRNIKRLLNRKFWLDRQKG